MDRLLLDLCFALRQLRRQPLFALAAVGTLALGIGAATAAFSVADAVLLRPLPYPEPEGLVVVQALSGGREVGTSEPEYLDYRAATEVFAGLAAVVPTSTLLRSAGQAEPLRAAGVTRDLFSTLGIAPSLGRVFDESETRPGGEPVVVLSHGLWRTAFGGREEVLGRGVRLGPDLYRIIGVMPAGFAFPEEETRLWIPLRIDEAAPWERNNHYLGVVGRLRPGVGLGEAGNRVAAVFRRGLEAYPDMYPTEEPFDVELRSLHEHRVGATRPALIALSGAVLLLLLIACANVAHLLLARAAARGEEVGLRSALGASPAALGRQFLVEGAVLSVLGGVAGAGAAWLGLRGLLALYPEALPRAREAALDGRALGATALLTLLAALLFGLAPALHGLRSGLRSKLAKTVGSGRGRQLHVASQTALAAVLFVGAALLIRSFVALLAVDPGFRWDHTLTATVHLPALDYPEPPQVAAAYRELLDQVRSLPGVVEAGAVWDLPTVGGAGSSSWSIAVEGRQAATVSEAPNYSPQFVTPGTFEALGTELVRGRLFDEGDLPGRQLVAIVNETMAKELWPAEDPLGKRFRMFPEGNPWLTVVGVVADLRQRGVAQAAVGEMYFAHRQSFEGAYASPRQMTLVVRHTIAAAALGSAVRRAVESLPGQPAVFDLRTLEDVRSLGLARERFLAALFGLFSAAALALAAVGVYGVLAWEVTQRRRELGVRAALGAAPARLLAAVVGRGLGPSLAGLAVGLAAALALGRLLSGLLYGVEPWDPASFAAVAVTLTLVATAASLLPARSAARIDPAAILRGN
jgi:putative ABC transport system permease protein